MNRVQHAKIVLWTIVGLAAAVGAARFVFGLGATTNLDDATPWGLWIGFDVMGGVALAAGGFVLTAICYVFKRERFHDLVRPAVLTAFLGYLAVVFGLLFDLGLPWNIWHMLIYWNPHSPLFEVGWCVMLYTTVLALEFSPVPLEETSRYARLRRFLLRFRFPLVLLGIMLSTLHQSSLGTLFLIMPYKLYPLWYSRLLPVQFFISAVALGLMMVTLESLVSHWLYRRKAAGRLVTEGLAKAVVWVLATYLIVKLGDIIASGELPLLFSGSWESILFLFEITVSAVIPLVLFSIPRVRSSTAGQWIGSSLVVFGMVLNRLDVGGLAMLGATGDAYAPSWMEIVVSMGVVSGAGLVFLFAIERLHIWERRPVDPEADPHAEPAFDHASEVWLGSPTVAARAKYSLAFVLSFAVGCALISDSRVEGKGVETIPVQKARGGEVLFIDGNHDSFGARFDHAKEIEWNGGKKSCVKCHHMNMPLDQQSGCWECHRNQYTPSNVFRHDWHASPDGADIPCDRCHAAGEERGKASAKKCRDCHSDLFPASAGAADSADTELKLMAPSYVDAMHGLCIKCHEKVAADQKVATGETDKASLTRCPTCHVSMPSGHFTDQTRGLIPTTHIKPVVMPEPSLEENGQPER
jgi:Ni/Fe-hydrogenase subunit HybB-like protein